MNRSTIIIVAAGFVFALLAALAVQMVSGKKAPSPEDAAKQIYILVAAKDLKVGEELAANSMQWAPWPETAQFAGAVVRDGQQKTDEALKGRVRRAVTKGEPLQSNIVVGDTKSSFVTAALAPGKRAVTVNVNAQSSVAGFVNPGDYVDVILTYDVKLPSDPKVRQAALSVVTKLASETILENLRVLASDQDTKKTDPKVGKTITLEAAPAQAETLALAAKMGTLSFALRPLGDDKPSHPLVEGKAVNTTTDIRVSGVMRELMKGENKSGSLSQVVRVYSGTRVDNVEVRPYNAQ